jgi:hypothetical protein
MLRFAAIFLLPICAGVFLAHALATHIITAQVTPPDDRSVICMRGHSAILRLPMREYFALRDAAFARAGKAVQEQCHGKEDLRPDCLILDHVIPLELCLDAENCNRLDNIQIQTKSDAAAKDRIENEERARYCRGEETREQAVAHLTRSVP